MHYIHLFNIYVPIIVPSYRRDLMKMLEGEGRKWRKEKRVGKMLKM
jgi:hypothetical protein